MALKKICYNFNRKREEKYKKKERKRKYKENSIYHHDHRYIVLLLNIIRIIDGLVLFLNIYIFLRNSYIK